MIMVDNKIRKYSDLVELKTFKERFDYLCLHGSVGSDTFGYDRYLNQIFYTSKEWRDIRRYVILRDHGCDLGINDREIHNQKIIIHHLNPLDKNDILYRSKYLTDPEYLISTTILTHNKIHYGVDETFASEYVERKKNDTCPWRH